MLDSKLGYVIVVYVINFWVKTMTLSINLVEHITQTKTQKIPCRRCNGQPDAFGAYKRHNGGVCFRCNGRLFDEVTVTETIENTETVEAVMIDANTSFDDLYAQYKGFKDAKAMKKCEEKTKGMDIFSEDFLLFDYSTYTI